MCPWQSYSNHQSSCTDTHMVTLMRNWVRGGKKEKEEKMLLSLCDYTALCVTDQRLPGFTRAGQKHEGTARQRGTDLHYALMVERLLGDGDSQCYYNSRVFSVPQEPSHKQEVSTQDTVSSTLLLHTTE